MQASRARPGVRPVALSMLAFLSAGALCGCRPPGDAGGGRCPADMIDPYAGATLSEGGAPAQSKASPGGPVLAEDRGDPKPGKDAKAADKPKVCCPAAPNGWKFVYSLESGDSRSTKREKARCAYRRIADDNDSMTALMNDKNQIEEVRRVLTKQKPPFDVVKTLTDQGAGNADPNCQICHTLTVVGATPPGHYIIQGREFDKVMKNNPNKQTVTGFDKTGKPLGNRDGLRNDLAPYK